MAAAGGEATYGTKGGYLLPQPHTERGVPSKIDVSPDGQHLIYTNGQVVVVRDIDDPSKGFIYGEHMHEARAAKFSPTGKYVASGDTSGQVRVWAWTHPDNLLKLETHALGSQVEDVAWDGESKRILAVGGGQGKAKVFAWDTGSNLSQIIPHDKNALSGAMKPNRPFRAVYGGLDFKTSFYKGPPFKREKGCNDHSNFVNCIRYAPDGSRFISVSSDKTGLVYDGTSGEKVGELAAADQHKGSIYAVSWSKDSSRVVTSAADKKLKVWDMGSLACTNTITVGTTVDDMQPSVVWARPELLVSLSLSGALNFTPSEGADAPTKVVSGHVGSASAIAADPETGRIVTGDLNGRVCVWTEEDGSAGTQYSAAIATGEGHKGKCVCAAAAGGHFATGAYDDRIRYGATAAGGFEGVLSPGKQPRGLAMSEAAPGLLIAVTGAAVIVYSGGDEKSRTEVGYGPSSVSLGQVVADGKLQVAVGGRDDKCVHFYTVDVASGALAEDGVGKAMTVGVEKVAISPDGKYCAAGDATREIKLLDAAVGGDHATLISGNWVSHTTKVAGMVWAPDSSLLCTVASDRRMCWWKPDQKACFKKQDLAWGRPFSGVTWAPNGAPGVWALGADGVGVRFDAPEV